MKKLFLLLFIVVFSTACFAACETPKTGNDSQEFPTSDSVTISQEESFGSTQDESAEDSAEQSASTSRKVVQPISGAGGYVFD